MKSRSSHNVNGVKGITRQPSETSPGMESHGEQVGPDRHHATVSNRSVLKIATWNVRTLNQCGKLENLEREATRYNINILGLSEVRWTGSGKTLTEAHTFIYSGGEKHERGVGMLIDKKTMESMTGYWAISDRVLLVKFKGKPFDISILQVYAPTTDAEDGDIDNFYEEIDSAVAQCKSQDIIFVMGDFNAKVGEGQEGNTVGPHGLGERNDRGDALISWCKSNETAIMNTWFKNHKRRKYTWVSPNSQTRNQIDYIMINQRFRNAVKQCCSYPGADINSDHNLVIAKVQLKLRKLQTMKQQPKLQLKRLREDKEVRKQFQIEVSNRFEVLQRCEENDIEEEWCNFEGVLNESAQAIIPKTSRKKKQKWMTNSILDMMDERRKAKGNDSRKYKELDREINQKCSEAKEVWWTEECELIEKEIYRNPSKAYNKVKELSTKTCCSSSGCLKSKEGRVIMERDAILKRWEEYIGDLFEDDRGEKPVIRKEMNGPPILKAEIISALRSMKYGKAVGPDKLSVEMIEALEDVGTSKLEHIMNKMYDTGTIPKNLSRSIFIALPKRPGATECELHRTISLMSHITKLMLKILMKRMKSTIHEEIEDVQCGFKQGKGTTNAIFILRNLTERSIEVQKDLYLCFIDYSKAFDKVQHEKLFAILDQLDIDGKTLRWISNLYWEQTAAVRVDDELSEWIEIKRGVRQGCVLSPDLFSLYSEIILRQIEDLQGVIVNGRNLNNIRYADDTVLISDTEEGLQLIVNKVIEESERMGLSLNTKKTYSMTVSKKPDPPPCTLTANGENIKQVRKFNYLGSLLTSDGKCDSEIRRRIALSREAFSKKKSVLTSSKIGLVTRQRILCCYVWSVLLYGCETWNISSAMKKRLEAVEIWFLRRMLKISWMDRKTNEFVLATTGVNRKLLATIRKRKMTFLGHVMRQGGLENLSLSGKIEGKRSRGRCRRTYLSDIIEWTSSSAGEVLHACHDRKLWKDVIRQHASE